MSDTKDDVLSSADVKVLSGANSVIRKVWRIIVAVASLIAALYSFENWNTTRLLEERLAQQRMIHREEFERRYEKMEAKVEKLDDRLRDVERSHRESGR